MSRIIHKNFRIEGATDPEERHTIIITEDGDENETVFRFLWPSGRTSWTTTLTPFWDLEDVVVTQYEAARYGYL